MKSLSKGVIMGPVPSAQARWFGIVHSAGSVVPVMMPDAGHDSLFFGSGLV
jgi:hypothetical protein